MPTSVLRGRGVESFLAIDVTGSTGRSLTAVEFAARTIRFTGTLGQSTIFRFPVNSTEDIGRTYTIENLTEGGYVVEVAPIIGGSVEIPSGSAITVFYDGFDMIGPPAAAATAIPVEVGGVISYYPITIQDPVIGDAITWTGDSFVNTPAGTATVAMGSAVAGGTPGSVLFLGAGSTLAEDNTNFFWNDTTNALGLGTSAPVASAQLEGVSTTRGWLPPRWSTTQRDAIATPATGLSGYNTTATQPQYYDGSAWGSYQRIGTTVTGATAGSVLFGGTAGVLAQDNANLFWADATNRLGIGTASPNAPLHVLNDSASTLATFKGASLFSSVICELGDNSTQAALRIYPGIPAAAGGNALVETGGLILRAHYWTGLVSTTVDTSWYTHITAATPLYYLTGKVGAVDRIHIRQDGQTTLGSSTPNTAGAVTQDVAIKGTTWIGADVTLDAGVDFAPNVVTGTRWGTAPTQMQGWWGGTPGVQMEVAGENTSDLLDSFLTQASARGLIATYTSPAYSNTTWLFIDPRNFTGSHGDPVSTLTDTSGNLRHATAAGSARGTLQVTSNLSPNGSRLVSLDGVDDSYVTGTTLLTVTYGVMITVAGNFVTNAGAGQVIFTDDTHGRPQCIIETFGTNLYAFRDEGHTVTAGAFSAGWQVLQWVFLPPSGGTGVAKFYRNGTLLSTDVWNFTPGSVPFLISGGPLSAKGYLGPVIVSEGDAFGGDINDDLREGIRTWIGSRYGT
jgi:hypothetical protein